MSAARRIALSGLANIRYVNALEKWIAKVSGGEEGYARALFAQSPRLGEGTLLYALEVSHNNGPWVHPDNMRKYNGVLRYSRDYYYASRLPGEPAAGVNDVHTHPAEPRSTRVSVLYSF